MRVNAIERRSFRRLPRNQIEWLVSTRLRTGHELTLLDLSQGGALVEGQVRLLPGSRVELNLVGAGCRHSVHGKVLRCFVSALNRGTGVCYRAALGFDRPLAETPGAGSGCPGSGYPCSRPIVPS